MKKIYIIILLSILILPFTSLADISISAPTNISIIRNGTSATLSWLNTEDASFSETVIFHSTIPIEKYFSYEAFNDGLCDKIYEGDGTTFTDTELAENLDYYYFLFSGDDTGNHSKAVVIEKEAFGYDQSKEENQNTDSIETENQKTTTLANITSEKANEVSIHEAGIVYNFNKRLELGPNSNSKRLALFIMVKSPHDLREQDKNAISYFIDQGTPTTILLGAGERTGVLNSYLSVFDKLPRDVLEWQDVIKIANGRWPDEKNIESEEKAADNYFSAIYKRAPNMDNPNDNAAVTVIAYGLRPADRNMKSEAKAIDIYRSIFNKSPVEANDWDLVRAIAYSGAIR